jgi:hypothetical protein
MALADKKSHRIVRTLAMAVLSFFWAESEGKAELVAPEPASNEEHASPMAGLHFLAHPHSLAMLEAGIIALPFAPISQATRGGATPFGAVGTGDSTLLMGLRTLFRLDPSWGLGAGILLGPRPTTEEYALPGTDIERIHSRSYFTVSGELRYFPVRISWVEIWCGVIGGIVTIADRYETANAPRLPKILGTPATTVRTEGLSLGAQIGADGMLTERWTLGVTLRSQAWVLPTTARKNAFGDVATVTGLVAVEEVAVNVGYRIGL